MTRSRRILRWCKRIVLGTLALALVLVATLLIVIHTDWGREKIRRRIEAALQAQFPGGATIEKLEGSIFGTLTLRGVELRSLDGKPAITVRTLAVEPAIMPLLHHRARLDSVLAEDVRIVAGAQLTRPSEQQPSQPEGASGAEGGGGSAWSIELPDITVRRGTLELADGTPISLDDLQLTGALAMPAGKPLGGSVDLAATWRERRLPVHVTAELALGVPIAVASADVRVGDVRLAAKDLVVDLERPRGRVVVTGSAAAIAAIEPRVQLPAGVELTITALGSQFELEGALGTTSLRGTLHGEVAGRSATGVLALGGVDAGKLTQDRVRGLGDVALIVDVNRAGIHGIAGVHGTAAELPESEATVVFDSDWTHARILAFAHAPDTDAAVVAGATRTGSAITVEHAAVVARGRDLAPWTRAKVAVASSRDLDLVAWLVNPAAIRPALDADVQGTLAGSAIAYQDVRVGSLDARFSGGVHGGKPTGNLAATALAISQAGTAIGSARVGARYLPDGRIRTDVIAHPAAAQVTVAIGGDITLGDVVRIALGKHAITPKQGAPWTGTGGAIAIADTKITVTGFTTTNGTGRARVDATLLRPSGDLDATVAATQLPASAIDPKLAGTASGTLAIKRRGGRWDGSGTFEAADLVVAKDAPVIAGTAKLEVHGRTVTLDAHARSPRIGGVRFELDVEGPRDITDVAAWRRLDRTALHDAKLTVEKVDLATAVPATGGNIDGYLQLANAKVQGSLAVTNVKTPLGIAEGQMTFSPLDDDLLASWNANLSDVGAAMVTVELGLPAHPFDPRAWKQLGRGMVKQVVASFDDIAIDPAKLAKLGIKGKYSGRATVRMSLGAAAETAKVAVDVRSISGGILTEALDVHVYATTDDTHTTACAYAIRTKTAVPIAPDDETCKTTAPKLVALDQIATPVAFATWVNTPKDALGSALSGNVIVPKQSAPAVLALVGRRDFDPKKGELVGSIALSGTLRKPGATASITVTRLDLISPISGRDIPELEKVTLVGTWDGVGGKITVTAAESNDRSLELGVTGRIDRPDDIVFNLHTNGNVDLAPLTTFLPGEISASTGVMHGYVLVTGIDPATARIRGNLYLDRGQIPIAPIVGTLRDTHASIEMTDAGITLKANGILNACRKDPNNPKKACTSNVTLTGRAPNDVSTLVADLSVDKISPLAEIEPIIDGKAHFDLRRTGRKWGGTITVKNGYIVVPPRAGDDLLEADAPEDVFFVEKPPPPSFFERVREPITWWLDAAFVIEPTFLVVPEYGVTGVLQSQDLRVRVGDQIGLDGKLVVVRGKATDVFGRDYDITPNEILSFDGTIDPRVEFEMAHSFNDLRLVVTVRGRLSDADFPHAQFTAEGTNHSYSEGELFGFFLGGDPSDAAAAQTKEVGIGIGTSVLSQAIAKRVKKVLPARLALDVIKCEPGTTAVGASCTFGKRFLKDDLYIAYKRRLAPLPNENGDEAQIQYYLSREWYLEGVGGSSNIIGADLLWRRRY